MEKRFSKNVLAMSLSCALVVVVASLVGADTPKFSDWSTPENLGPIVNSAFLDQGPFISKDSLSLYFASTRPGSYGDNDFWVSQRASVDAPWEPPQNLGAIINTTARESTPTLSLDGHFLYFASSRPGGFGGLDLYVSRRHDKEDDFGWQTPVNLGSARPSPFTFIRLGPDPGAPRALACVTSIAAHSTRTGSLLRLSSCLNSAPASRTNNQPSGGTGSSCTSSLIVWAVSAQATYGFRRERAPRIRGRLR